MTSSQAQRPCLAEATAWRRYCKALLLAAILSPATGGLHAAQVGTGYSTSKSLGDWGVTLAVHEGDLIVGGLFSSAGGVQTGLGSARFNGTAWQTLVPDSRFDGPVEAFLIDGDDLFVGGIADTAGGVPVSSIARWDGTNWHALGGLLQAEGQAFVMVNSLAMYEGKLIAGGVFTTAGEPPARNIAAWDGTAWTALGAGHNNDVRRLYVHDGRLFASPRASEARVWDGSAWQPVPGGPGSTT